MYNSARAWLVQASQQALLLCVLLR